MTMMNETIKSQLGHRTIRKFKDRKNIKRHNGPTFRGYSVGAR